jgi:hypothetical protein
MRFGQTLILAALMLAGLLPVWAIHPNVGANLDDFTVLAGANVTVSAAGQALVNGAGAGGVAGSPGRTGAVTSIGGGTITSSPGGNVTGGIVPVALNELGALKTGLSACPPTFTFGATQDLRTLDVDGMGPLNAGEYPPGVYSFVNVNVSDGGGSPDITFLNGPGEYIFNISGNLTTSDNVQMLLGSGTECSDIWWNVGNVANIGASNQFTGKILAETSCTIADGTTVCGKAMARVTDVSFVDDGSDPRPTVDDSGFAPNVTIDGQPVNCGVENRTVCIGDTLQYTVFGSDPDGGGSMSGDFTLERTKVNPMGAGAGFTSPASAMGANNATLNEVFDSSMIDPMLGGTTVTACYTATDEAGCVTTFQVDILVSRPPVFDEPPTPPDGAVLEVCPNELLEFTVQGSDPDMGDSVILRLAVGSDPVPAWGSFTPGLPTGPDNPVSSTFSGTPSEADENTTTVLIFELEDEAGCITTRTITICVHDLPDITIVPQGDETSSPPTPGVNDPVIFNICVGGRICYDICAVDEEDNKQPEPETVVLSVESIVPPGYPALGAAHDPNEFGNDVFGYNGGDALVGLLLPGNPVKSRFSWTPKPADVGMYDLLYTAEDSDGCIRQVRVIINVSQYPAFDYPPTPPDGTCFLVCPGDQLQYNVAATDPDGDQVTLSASVQVISGPAIGGALVHNPALPTNGTPTAITQATFAPTVANAGGNYLVTYTAVDPFDCAVTTTVCLQVPNVPVISVLNAAGQSTGTTFNLCVGDPLRFRVRATDADGPDDHITLTQSGAPAGMVFTPVLPTAGNPVETVVDFTPTSTGTSLIDFTATDETGCDTTVRVTINASVRPTLQISSVTGTAPSSSGDGSQNNPYVVCAGTPFSYLVTAGAPISDTGETVTLTSTALPAGAIHNPALPQMAPAPLAASSTFQWTPSAAQGGQTFSITYTATDDSPAACSTQTTVYIRVSHVPDVTANGQQSLTIDVCEGDSREYRIRATDGDISQDVWLELVSIVAPGGAPTLPLVHTPGLPLNDNPIETVVTFVAPEVTTNTTYTVTYRGTDPDGCTDTVVVTINVYNTVPTTVQIIECTADGQHLKGDPTVDQLICVRAVVLDNCPAQAGGPRPVPGVQTCFELNGANGGLPDGVPDGEFVDGNEVEVPPFFLQGVTDANGEVVFCYTPCFSGEDSIEISIDQNGNCVADGGTNSDSKELTIRTRSESHGCTVEGRGNVEFFGDPFGGVPTVASFNLGVKRNLRGRLSGKVNMDARRVLFLPAGTLVNFRFRGTRITAIHCTEDNEGRKAVIEGTGTANLGIGPVRFRVDCLDAGTPGIPNDRFFLKLLLPSGQVLGPWGGSLGYGRNNRGAKVGEDIKIRSGLGFGGNNGNGGNGNSPA